MNNATAVGIADGGGTVGTLTISNVGVGVGSNLGSAVDIDQGGTLNVSLELVTSSGAARGVDLGTTTGVGGTFGGIGHDHHQRRHRRRHRDRAIRRSTPVQRASHNRQRCRRRPPWRTASTSAPALARANTGTYSFNGGVNITVNGTNAFGFRGQNSGTVNITDVGTTQITSQNGTALLINPTTLNATLDFDHLRRRHRRHQPHRHVRLADHRHRQP